MKSPSAVVASPSTRHDGDMDLPSVPQRKAWRLRRPMVWAALLPIALSACSMRPRTARPEPTALTAPGSVAWKPHVGEVFQFEYPDGWEVQTPAGQDPGLHQVRLHSTAGFQGQLTLLREAPAPGTFPSQVVEKLRRGEQSLKVEQITAELAGLSAQGYRFSFDKEGVPWTGWVASCTRGTGELCAMGRWPAHATDLHAQWSVIARNLRVKADGFPPLAPRPPVVRKELPLDP